MVCAQLPPLLEYWTQLLSIAAQRGAAREIGFGAFKAGAAAADRLRREG